MNRWLLPVCLVASLCGFLLAFCGCTPTNGSGSSCSNCSSNGSGNNGNGNGNNGNGSGNGNNGSGGGDSTTDFTLQPNLRDALQSAQAHGKKVMLSLGGEAGSTSFVAWWNASGAATTDRVAGMRAKLQKVAQLFAQQNGVNVDGYDVD